MLFHLLVPCLPHHADCRKTERCLRSSDQRVGHFLYSPYRVYGVHAALSSICIINSTISMKQKYIFHRKDALRAFEASFRFSLCFPWSALRQSISLAGRKASCAASRTLGKKWSSPTFPTYEGCGQSRRRSGLRCNAARQWRGASMVIAG